MANITCSIPDHQQTATSCAQDSFTTFQEYTDLIDDQSTNLCTLRGLMKLKNSETPVPSRKSSLPKKS